MMQFFYKYISEKTGFTLVETLVAISILMLAIVGPMGFVANGLVQSQYSKDQIIAFYLAQEGVELIRAERDRVALELDTNPGRDWLGLISTQCKTANGARGCAVSVRTSISSAPGCGLINAPDDLADACRIYKDPSIGPTERGIYHHTQVGNTPTQYQRVVSVNEIADDQAAEIISTVYWKTGYLPLKRVRVRGYIYNQYNNLYTP